MLGTGRAIFRVLISAVSTAFIPAIDAAFADQSGGAWLSPTADN